MFRWRLATALFLALTIALPAGLPFLDLLLHPQAWLAWTEYARLLELARSTAGLVLGTLTLVLPVGILSAILLYRTDLPWQSLLQSLTLLTLFIPLPLFASAWQALLGTAGWYPLAGWANPAVGPPWAQGLAAAVWVHAVAAWPWVVVLVGQGLRWVERELEEDARTILSASQVLWRVTLPRASASIAAAALWVALQTATEITVTDMMSVRTYAEEVYTQFVRPEVGPGLDSLARAVAVSVPAIVFTCALTVWIVARWESRLPPPEGLTEQPWQIQLGWARWPCLGAMLCLLGFLVGVPVASLVWKLGIQGHPPSWLPAVALEHLDKVLRARGRLIGESLALAASAGLLTAGTAWLASWLAVGARWYRFGLLSLLAVAWALPGPVLGIGLKATIEAALDATNSQVLARLLYYGPSPLPILWAYLLRFLPYAVALIWPVLRLWPLELRDLARMDGLSPVREFWLLVVPLTFPAALRAALAVAVLALGELSAGKLVETPGAQTFAHEVFNQMHYGVTNDLAALCLLLLAAVLVLTIMLLAASRMRNPGWGTNP